MELNNYQNLARQTAIYPGKGKLLGLNYTILGLIGEASEYHENPSIAEKGDNFWYMSQIAFELELPFSHLAKGLPKNYKNYISAVGSLANTFKKIYRDDNQILTSQKRTALIEILQEIFYFLTTDGLDNKKALEENIAKLKSRQSCQTLTGSGDTR